MAKLSLTPLAEVVAESIAGGTSRRHSPDGYSLWIEVLDLEPGGGLTWAPADGDEAVYVAAGETDVVEYRADGRRAGCCPPGGAVIVEQGARAVLTSVGVCQLVRFGSTAPVGVFGRGVHVFGPRGWGFSGDPAGTHATWFSDSTWESTPLTLLQVGRDTPSQGPSHHHSQDEIIYLLDGSISLGSLEAEPGAILCIPANVRYRITAGPAGYRFLNYRSGPAAQVYERDSAPQFENVAARHGHLTDDRIL
ncbi:hypothetical protein [Candidatus Poriferisocius sp.]|uniref:hypothetical protein n=1 Tax=Candidatus Poriferisocius sp. TaxID=3101276 RepID=UPI003B01CD67